ncbi:hypothetical protein EDD15DRAFT_2203960 [Pisolithus albus]|nr:hypothetical protein EDD15DRAFT_2203960 [Pisolithus albus]
MTVKLDRPSQMPAAQKRVGFEREKKKWGRNLPRLRENIVSDYVMRVEPIAFIALRKISDEKSALYGVPTVRCGHSTTVTGVNRTKSTRCFQRKGVWNSGEGRSSQNAAICGCGHILAGYLRRGLRTAWSCASRRAYSEVCISYVPSLCAARHEKRLDTRLQFINLKPTRTEQTIHLTGDTDDEEVFTAKPKHHYSPVCPQRLSTSSIPSSPTRLTAPFPIPIVGPNVACTSTGPLTPKLQNHLTDSTGKITISAVSEDMRPFAQAYNRMLDILGEVISVAERALQD